MILFTNILWVSIGLKLISIIDNATVYNSTGAHAAEEKGGTFRRLANHNTLSQLTNLSPSREGLHKPGNKSRRLSEKGQRGVE